MLNIYHNPRCSKSRQTLQLIQEAHVKHEVIEYLKTPLNEHELRSIAQKLNVAAIEMMRTKEIEFKEQHLKGASEDTLFAAMAATPKLIERPIVTKDNKAVICRPPENVSVFL